VAIVTHDDRVLPVADRLIHVTDGRVRSDRRAQETQETL
jgi:ABC-type siderophore export system fused ATPase/permease subunit